MMPFKLAPEEVYVIGAAGFWLRQAQAKSGLKPKPDDEATLNTILRAAHRDRIERVAEVCKVH